VIAPRCCLAAGARLGSRGDPNAQSWELMLKDGGVGAVQAVADQAQVHVRNSGA